MKRAAAIALAALLLIAAGGIRADAHGQNTWYACSSYNPNTWCHRWPTALRSKVTITWASRAWEDDRELGANGRQRVRDAADAWNNVGEPTKIVFPGTTDYNASVTTCPTVNGRVNTFYRWYDDSNTNPNSDQASVARVTRCRNSDGLRAAILEFNAKYTFWTGGGAVPAGAVSLWGVAVHELGHVTGFQGHWDTGPAGSLDAPSSGADRKPCTDDPATRHTMCALYIGKAGSLRSLEDHDEHTFGNAY